MFGGAVLTTKRLAGLRALFVYVCQTGCLQPKNKQATKGIQS